MAEQPEPESVLGVADAANRLGLAPTSVLSAIQRHQLAVAAGRPDAATVGLRASRQGIHRRGAWEIRLSDLDAYAERLKGTRKPGRPRATEASVRDQAPALLTLAEVARQTGLTRYALGRLIDAGELTPVRRESRRVWFSRESVERLLARRGGAGSA